MNRMKSLRVVILTVALLSLWGCRTAPSRSFSTHEKLSRHLTLPRNLCYGGFYDAAECRFYVVLKNGRADCFKGRDLQPISISEIPRHRQVVVYVDASASWTVLRDLMRDLDECGINRINIAFNSDDGCGTVWGETFLVQFAADKEFDYVPEIVLQDDGSTMDVVSGAKYQSGDYRQLMIEQHGFMKMGGLIRGSQETTVGELLQLFDSLGCIQHSRQSKGVFLDIR